MPCLNNAPTLHGRRRPFRRHAHLIRLIAFRGLMALAAASIPHASWAQARVTIGPEEGVRGGSMSVALGKSRTVRLDRTYTELSVGNPDIADVVPITDRSVYVLGKKIGATNLTVYGPNKQVLAVVDIAVTNDLLGLKTQLHELLPGERIEVRAVNDSIVLTGEVTSAPAAQRAAAIAERFAPEHVLNQMSVRGSQQVMLQVRVSEVKRSLANRLGLKPSFHVGNPGKTSFAFTTLDPVDTTRFGLTAATVGATGGFASLTALIDALEQNGLVKTLAEPNLVALSGDTANFLAGGEFPIPVAQTGGPGGLPVITVAFKQFGVSLSFTPTVLEGDLINMVVAPEVSEIDRTNAVEVTGFSIPGISTRRATTTVELRDGQGFAIAGLLQNDITNTVRQLPGLGNVPILGALFRDTDFLRNETELVIIVIPHLVKPAPASALLAPTDSFVPATELDGFLYGRVESPESGLIPGAPSGGLSGSYGHIIR